MIQPIRKRHKITWVAIAIILPLLFAFALVFTPEEKTDNAYSSGEKSFEKLRSTEVEGNVFSVVQNNSGVHMLEIDLSEPVKSAFAVVSVNTKSIGTLNSEKVQHFTIDHTDDKLSVVIFDEIDKKEILKAEL